MLTACFKVVKFIKDDANVQIMEYHQLPNIKSNDVNRSLLDSMNQEVQVRDSPSYENEVYNEGMFILDINVDAWAPNEEDVQLPIQVTEESKLVENSSSPIPYDYSLDIQKFDHMLRKIEMGHAIATDEGWQRAASECKPLPNPQDFQFWCPALKHMKPSRLESEHVEFCIPNALLVGKQLHPLVALFLFLEKLKAYNFSICGTK